MNTQNKLVRNSKDRKSERGAALITVLMISFLLLVAVISLILESSMNTANVTDATSEEQAYYAAESGIQSTVDALRHNPRPNPLLAPTPDPPDPDADEANHIDYLKAITRETSNQCTKSGATYTCADPLDNTPNDLRLSRWLPYNWGPNGGAGAASKDRIVLGDPNTYSPLNGFAYSVKVFDPDFSDGRVRYTAAGDLDLTTSGNQASKQFGSGSDTTTITYVPPASQDVDVISGTRIGSLGSFTVTTSGAGGTIPAGDGLWRFKIILTKTGAGVTTVVFRGYILPASMTTLEQTPSGSCTMTGISYLFDSQYYAAFGSRLELIDPDPLPAGSPATCQVEERQDGSSDSGNGPDGVYLAGWRELSAPVDQPLNLRLKISQPQPTRLLIKSTGYGPKGAKKELETIIQQNYFDGLGAPSPLTMIGPRCTPFLGCADTGTTVTNTTFSFSPGNSRPVYYTGKDRQLRYFLPPIGATNDTNTNLIRAATDLSNSFNGAVYGTPENLLDELPPWLQTPANLHEKVLALREEAESSGTYWLGDQTGVPVGDYATGTGITFIDGNLQISPSQDGGGILIVNGTITNNGGYFFKGLILIIGTGGMDRRGGGSAVLEGNMVIAPYMSPGRRIRTALNATMEPSLACSGTGLQTTALTNSCFYAPRYSISGGGGSDVMYNSQSVQNGLNGLGNFVKGVAEK